MFVYKRANGGKVSEVQAIAIFRAQDTSNLRNLGNTIHFYTVQKSLYVFGTDYDTLEAESIVARWDFVGC
jgi:hypothetical protein